MRLLRIPARRLIRIVGVSLIVLTVVGTIFWRQEYAWCQVTRARHLLAVGQIEQAIQVLRTAERVSPNHAEVLYQLGRALRRSGKSTEFPDYLVRAERAGWSRENIQAQQMLALIQSGRFEEAETFTAFYFERGCSDELAEEIYEARAKGFFSQYRLDDALLCLNFWIDWRKDSVLPKLIRADLWERCERTQAAIDDYRAILQIDPRHQFARRSLAQLLLTTNTVPEAIVHFHQCIKSDPGDVMARVGLAECLHRTGKLSEAEAILRELLNLQSPLEERAEILVGLGKVLLLKNDYRQAADFLEQAVEADPKNRTVYYNLGMAYTRLGRADEGKSLIDRGKDVNERYVRMSEITRALISKPADADLRWEAGSILMKQGMKAEGAAWMLTALNCDPSHVRSHADLAEFYAETGDILRSEYHRTRSGEAPSGNGSTGSTDLP